MEQREKFRADLHYHGPIGLTPYWLRVQGYKGKNLLKLIVDTCFKRKIDICAITSQIDELDASESMDSKGVIIRGSVHDRLGYLAENYLSELNKINGYRAERLGPNSIIVEKESKLLYLINGQTVRLQEGEQRFDHLAVFSNEVPNHKGIDESAKYCNDRGIPHGLEHMDLEVHWGIGQQKAKEIIHLCDFVEGHNSQLIVPRIFVNVPIIGKYTKLNNDNAKEFAKRHNMPYIATSDGHMIKSAGLSYIEAPKAIDTLVEEKLKETLHLTIKSGQFSTRERYENPIDWLEWTFKFMWGVRGKRYKRG